MSVRFPAEALDVMFPRLFQESSLATMEGHMQSEELTTKEIRP